VGLLVAGLAIGGLLFKYENDVTRIRLQELAAPFQTAIQTAVRQGQQPREALASLEEQVQAANARVLIVSPGNNPTAANAQRRVVGGVRAFTSDQRARAPVGGPAEVRELGGAFNEMAGEIDRARTSEQAFLADISHELRTPLTSIHGFAQAIAEGEARGDGVP